MEWIKLNLDWILDLGTLLLSACILFINSYLKQRGKNNATKQDIAEITTKVESVKNRMTDLTFKRNDHFIEYKKSILDYNKELVIWIELSIKDISIVTADPFDGEMIKEKLYHLQLQYSNVKIAYWKVFIYTDNDEKWFSDLGKLLDEIKPLYDLTRHYLDSSCGQATLLNNLKGADDANSIPDKILAEHLLRRETFLAERDRIENDSLKALRSTSLMIRDQLREEYKKLTHR